MGISELHGGSVAMRKGVDVVREVGFDVPHTSAETGTLLVLQLAGIEPSADLGESA